MTQNEAINYWRTSAKETVEAAKDNYQIHHIDWSFFLWHLAIEKLIKGLIVKQGNVPPPVHDLVKLADNSKINLTREQEEQLGEISSYNIKARYDDYKRKFYKKVIDKKYHEIWFKICENLFLWLDKKY